MTATVQINVNISMGGWSAAKKMYETWKSLFHVVDLVVDLEMPDVPTTTAKKLRFILTPRMVKTATELYLDNLKQLVISVFAHVRRKVIGQFDEARVAAEALVVDVDPAMLVKRPEARSRILTSARRLSARTLQLKLLAFCLMKWKRSFFQKRQR